MMTDTANPSADQAHGQSCAECGASFTKARAWSAFCSPACRTASNDRDRVQGRALVKLGKAMRLARNVKGSSPEAVELRAVGAWAFNEMCALLDDYAREDVKAGRPSALLYAAQVRASEYRPSLDRRGAK